MAQDWMKVEKSTPSKPKIIRIAKLVGINRHDAFGKCFDIWAHFDTHSINGFLEYLDAEWIDKFVDKKGFASAMQSVGWLIVSDDGLHLPNFDEHISETAKKRALTAQRAERHRNVKPVTHEALRKTKNVTREALRVALPEGALPEDALPEDALPEENRREENTPLPPKGEKGLKRKREYETPEELKARYESQQPKEAGQ